MSQYSAIKAATNAYIKTNGRQEITGAILNAVMIATIDSLGKYYQFVGNADPDTNPGNFDQNIAYIAAVPGTYTHLGGFTLAPGEVAVIKFDGEWHKEAVATIPAKVSQLQNDLGFITNAVSDLVNYYTKGETFTKSEVQGILLNYYDRDEVDSIVSVLTRQSYVVAWDGTAEPVVGDIPAGVSVTWGGNPYVGTLPASASTIGRIYLVSNGAGYDEYITTEDGGYSWISIGTTSIDLSDYATKAEVSQLEAEVGEIGDTVDGSYLAENFTKEVVDFSTATLRNYIINDTNKYGTSTSYKHAIIQVSEGDVVDVSSNSSYEARIGFVNDLSAPADAGDIPVVTGTTVVYIPVNKSKRFIVPAGAVAVVVNYGGSGGGSAPSAMTVYRKKVALVPGNRVLTGIAANGYSGSGASLSLSSSYYGVAYPVKNGKVYLIDVSNAGTGTKYYGFLPMVAGGVTFTSRDTASVANAHFVLTAPADGYFLLTKSNNSFSVSVTELGIPVVDGNEKDLANSMSYLKIDPSSYTKRNYRIQEDTGLYGTSSTYKHILVPVSPGDYIKVHGNIDNGSRLAFFTSDTAPTSGGMPPYAPGTGLVQLSPGEDVIMKTPAGANFLFINYGSDGGPYPVFVGKSSQSEEIPDAIPITAKSFQCVAGCLSYVTGLYPAASFPMPMSHTPRFIRNYGWFNVLYEGSFGICFYDENQTLIECIYEDLIGPVSFERTDATFFRIYTRTEVVREIQIQSRWNGNDEVFQKLPADEGYQGFGFGVNLNKGFAPNSTGVSALTTGFVSSYNFGVIHLPASYKENGPGTPLIIYLHGSADRYKVGDKRFATNIRYSPEWDSMGFAQMDVDMIPAVYNEPTSTDVASGTGDDAVCVESAYRWAIEHFNIRRDGVYLFGRSRGGETVLEILGKLNQIKMPVVCALSNAGANSIVLYNLFRPAKSTWWRIFCESMGLDALNPPAHSSGNPVANSAVVQFLRDNIDIWWDKAMVSLPMLVDNPTEYQTPTQIFDLLVASYNEANEGKTFIEDFVERCKFRSPVPLRFDWCYGDTTQAWESTPYGTYGSAGKDGFVNNKLTGNAIYRRWPSCPEGENAHFHEMFNLEDYTLPNGVEIEDASMAMTEWLLWAMGQDERFTI